MRIVSLVTLFCMLLDISAMSQSTPIRVGKHQITLQWIGTEKPGTVVISHKTKDLYFIKGEQRNAAGDYITVEGLIKVINAKELRFEGNILSRVSHINGGQPCIREGVQVFKATGKRKYWRLQKMINCEGGMVTDYIDIYF